MGLFQKRASVLRHAVDLLDFFLCLGFIYMVYFLAGPYQAQIRLKEIQLNDETFLQLYHYHVAFFVMNIVNLLLPIIRFVEGRISVPRRREGKGKKE